VDPHRTSLERAFELARSGRYATIDETKQRLTMEMYDQHMVEDALCDLNFASLIAGSRSKAGT
jgi:hypothetical protein